MAEAGWRVRFRCGHERESCMRVCVCVCAARVYIYVCAERDARAGEVERGETERAREQRERHTRSRGTERSLFFSVPILSAEEF